MWRRYILLYSDVFPNPDTSEWRTLMDFCEEHVELESSFWNSRINSQTTGKGDSLEKYISRVLTSDDVRKFELQLLNAIIYRSFLYSLELNFTEATLTISNFLEVLNELEVFRSRAKCILWQIFTFIHLNQTFPTFILPLKNLIDLNQDWPNFAIDENLYDSFELHEEKNNFQIPLGDYSELKTDLKSGIEEVISTWSENRDAAAGLIQLVEIYDRLDNANGIFSLSTARQLPKCVELWALSAFLSENPTKVWEESLVRMGENVNLTFMAVRYWFNQPEDEENCASALRSLEEVILPYFERALEEDHDEPSVLLLFRKLIGKGRPFFQS